VKPWASSQRFMAWPIGMLRDWHGAEALLPFATFSIRERKGEPGLGGSFLAFCEPRPQTELRPLQTAHPVLR
jgi:hypothetical protein